MSEKKTETAKAETAATVEANTGEKAAGETVVYCGPTVRGVARQFTVFSDGAPQKVQDFCTKYPVAANLVVPLEQFAAARKNISEGTGRESALLRSLKKQMEEG